MSDTRSDKRTMTGADGGAIYVLGILGAWVFFWQQADGFWSYVLAVLEGFVWPAFLVYEALSALS